MTHLHRAHADLRAHPPQLLFRRALYAGWGVSPSPWRLADLLDRLGSDNLDDEVDDRPCITLGSKAILMDLESEDTFSITLVTPEEADPEKGLVSVFSPLGLALAGRRKGQYVEAEFLRYRLPIVVMNVIPTRQEVEP